MRPIYRDHAREDIAREMDRLSRLRRDREKLLRLADDIRAETDSLMKRLERVRLDNTLH